MSRAFLNQDDTLTVEPTTSSVPHDQWEAGFAARLAEREQRAACTCRPLMIGGMVISVPCTATAHHTV